MATKKSPMTKKGMVKYFTRKALEFLTLHVGDKIEGVYLSQYLGDFGPVYKIRKDDGTIVGLNSRIGMVNLFAEAEQSELFADGTMIGHRITVERITDAETKKGNTVAQFRLGHVIDGCPKGCAE